MPWISWAEWRGRTLVRRTLNSQPGICSKDYQDAYDRRRTGTGSKPIASSGTHADISGSANPIGKKAWICLLLRSARRIPLCPLRRWHEMQQSRTRRLWLHLRPEPRIDLELTGSASINHEVDVRIPGGVFVQFSVVLVGGEAAGHTTITFFRLHRIAAAAYESLRKG